MQPALVEVATEGASPPSNCANCGAVLVGPYCAQCGQERHTRRRSISESVRRLYREIVGLENQVIRTVIALLVEPGELPLAFHRGRTRRYVPAVRLYLLVSLLFFLTLSMTDVALVQFELREVPNSYVVKVLPDGDLVVVSNGRTSAPISRKDVQEAADSSMTPGVHSGIQTDIHFFAPIGRFHQTITPSGWVRIEQIKASILKQVGNDPNGWMARNALGTIEQLGRDPAALNGPLMRWTPRVLFLLLPLFALLLSAFYVRHRKQFYFVDHLNFSLSIHSFIFVMLILAIGAAQLLSGAIVADVVLLSIAVYLLIALKRFYGQSWIVTVVKFVSICFVYSTFFLAPALVAVVVTSLITG